MRLQVLVPHHSEQFFAQSCDLDLDPVYYRLGKESAFQRVWRKFGRKDTHLGLNRRVRIGEADLRRLDHIAALWLSPELFLPAPLMACLLDQLPELKWAYSQVTGIEHLDLEEFKKRGVMVSNSGDLNSRRVAEMVLACICSHVKRLPKHIELQRDRKWQGVPSDDLNRQTVGVIGTGNIGRNVAALCKAVGMRALGASRNPARFGDDCSPFHRVVRLEGELDLLLAEADHVVIAMPLNEATRGLIGKPQLAKMKKSASIVNIARGPIVNEAELCHALAQGEIAAAFIDRPSQVPLPVWSRMYRTPNLVLTHYSAAQSSHMRQEGFEKFVAGLRQLTQNGQPPDRVA